VEVEETRDLITVTRLNDTRARGERERTCLCGVRNVGTGEFQRPGLLAGAVTRPMALAELGLIDEYEFAVQPGRSAARVRALLAAHRERKYSQGADS
jgi:hypothetical protein